MPRTRKPRSIAAPGAPATKGQCPIRPKLDGSQGNPMRFCEKKAGHTGRHSWERPSSPTQE